MKEKKDVMFSVFPISLRKQNIHKIFRVHHMTPLKIFKFNWWGNMWLSERGKIRTRSLLGNSKAVWLSRHLRDSFIFQSHLTWIPSLVVGSYISITIPLSYKTLGDLQKAYVSTHHVSTSEPGFLDVGVYLNYFFPLKQKLTLKTQYLEMA